MAMDKHSNTEDLPVALRQSLERLLDLIRSDTVKRELWANRFTTADRRKFNGTDDSVLKRHHTVELWHIARGTPTFSPAAHPSTLPTAAPLCAFSPPALALASRHLLNPLAGLAGSA